MSVRSEIETSAPKTAHLMHSTAWTSARPNFYQTTVCLLVVALTTFEGLGVPFLSKDRPRKVIGNTGAYIVALDFQRPLAHRKQLVNGYLTLYYIRQARLRQDPSTLEEALRKTTWTSGRQNFNQTTGCKLIVQ